MKLADPPKIVDTSKDVGGETDLYGGDGAASREGGGPRAMTRVIRLCETLAQNSTGLTLSELSARLETPKSTLLNSLRPLVQDDFLAVEGPLYRLGPAAFRLAAQITSAWSLPRLVSGYMRELASQTGESVGLAVPDWPSRRAVYIEAIQSPRPVLYAMKVGVSGPLYATAAGRVMLAHTSKDWLDTYLETTRFKPFTRHTQVEAGVIRQELMQAREQGWWLSVEQLLDGTATLAAPIFNAEGGAAAAISLGAPVERMQRDEESLRGLLLAMTLRVSSRIQEQAVA